MTQTRKFSQFGGPSPIQPTDIVVGLRNVAGLPTNFQFTGVGSGGGGGGVTTVITQTTPILSLGEWVRINSLGEYVAAQADNSVDGECIGVVVLVNGNEYTIQQAGYVASSTGVFSGLTDGEVYFLSTAVAGAMIGTDATVNGQVSRPVFVADTPSSGWVVPYRPMLVGGAIANGGGGTTPSPEIITVNQPGHALNVGNWVYVSIPVGGHPAYLPGIATSLAASQVVGVVIEVIDANNFVLQFSGYVSGGVPPVVNGNVYCPYEDQASAALIPSTVYYLSPTTAGNITSVNPIAIGQISKPLFVSEQTIATTGLNAGYILPQRPLDEPDIANNVHTVVVANAFHVGQWVYNQGPGNNAYALASATSLAAAQVAGIVTSATANQFTIQQSGWNTGSVTTPYTYVDGGAVTPGIVYYLSAITPGNISSVVPATLGQATKPCYVQESGATFTGEVLPQRPLLVVAPSGPSSQTLISTTNIAGPVYLATFSGAIPNGYTGIRIVGSNIVVSTTDGTQNRMQGPGFQLEYGGVMKTDNNYLFASGGNNTYVVIGNASSPGIWTDAGATPLPPPAIANQPFTFEINIWGNDDTTHLKTFNWWSLTCQNFTSYAPTFQEGEGWYQNSAAKITGFQLTSQVPMAPSGYVYLSGTISIYGTIS